MSSDFVRLNEGRFYYEIAGQGHPLVMLHAGIADLRMWGPQFQALADNYQVVRYDRRGFGQTKMVDASYAHYQDLHDLLAHLNLEPVVLLGCSQGGRISIDFTLAYPDKTKALILVASALSGFEYKGQPPKQWDALFEADEADNIEVVNELELQIWVDGPQRTPDQVDAQVRELVRQMNLVALMSPDVGDELILEPLAVDRLDEIQVPTLIIVGDMDTPRTIAIADYLAKHIPHAQKVIMPGTAHLPNLEQPERFNTQVTDFLARL